MKKFLTTAAACCIALAGFSQSFFTQVNYRGAFGTGAGANWTSGWANWDPKNTLYPGDPGYAGAPATLVNIPAGTHITTNTTWSSGNYYRLLGPCFVDAGVTLTIQAGTVIRGVAGSGSPDGTSSYLLVRRGAQINAVGTSTNPIVFTSDQAPSSRNTGDWGGVLLCGNAPINIYRPDITTPVTQVYERRFEGLSTTPEALYGGGATPNAADNSGTMQYIRIEFAGDEEVVNQELNGLMLAGVGSSTTIDHIMTSYSNDDSFEWFGGTVNAKYLIAFAGTDDDFDIDEGFSGKVQFALAVRHPNFFDNSSGGNNSHNIEADNNTTASGAPTSSTTQYSPGPVTSAVFANVTLIGPLRPGEANNAVAPQFSSAINWRTNPAVGLFNVLVLNPQDAGLTTNTAAITSPASITTGPSNFTKIGCDSLVLGNSDLLLDPANTTGVTVSAGGFAGTTSNCGNPLANAAQVEALLEGSTYSNTIAKTSTVAATLGITAPYYTGMFSSNGFGFANAGTVSFASFDPTLATGSAYLSGASFVHPKIAPFVTVGPLTVSTAQSVNGGYTNVTVTGTGTLTMNGNMNVTGTFTVQSGGTLNMNGFRITGSGSFVAAAGAIITTQNTAGFTSSGPTGAVQVTGTRNYGTDASYTFNGTAAQVTGNGLSTVRGLRINNAAGVTLSQALTANGIVALQAGAFTTGGNLTIGSTAALQGMVDDFSAGNTGTLTGNITVQRRTTGNYRHVASPVSGATLGSITSQGISCTSIREFEEPTNTWIPLGAGCDGDPILNTGSSYLAQATGVKTFSYTGGLVSGTQTGSIIRSAVPLGQISGWNALGNPYPSPIRWSLVDNIAGNTANSALAAYIWNSNNNAYGTITAAGVTTGGANDFIGVGQGFLVRRSAVGGPSNLTFNNTIRVASSTQTFIREGSSLDEEVRLTLAGADGKDEVLMFTQEGAEAGMDAFDAEKINSMVATAPNFYVLAGEKLTVNAMPALAGNRTIDLGFSAPAGSYTIEAQSLAIPAGYSVVLEDKAAGRSIELTSGAAYTFQANSPSDSRFVLHFRKGTAQEAIAGRIALVYASNGKVNVMMENGNENGAAVTILNNLGQVAHSTRIEAGQTAASFPVSAPAGVYSVRVQSGGRVITQKVYHQAR